MSEALDLSLILRNTENASRDSRAALEATLRFIESFGPRLNALEGRFSALEARTAGIERTLDEIARVGHQTGQDVAAILAKLS